MQTVEIFLNFKCSWIRAKCRAAQGQLFRIVPQRRCFEKFCQTYRKSHWSKSFLLKLQVGLQFESKGNMSQIFSYKFYEYFKNRLWKENVWVAGFVFLEKYIAQKMKFPFRDLFSKYNQIRSFLRIWPHLLNKTLMENFIFVQWNSVLFIQIWFRDLSI